MDVQDAVDNFGSAVQHCDNLIAVHRIPRAGRPGRRTMETSVNRGTIVLTVAAWQAFVQDLAKALRDESLRELASVGGATTNGVRLLHGAMTQWETDFNAALEKFSTPGPDQSRALWRRVGFDPRSSWTWTQHGGRGSRAMLVEPKHVAMVITQWLRVRHDVAHGHSSVHSLPVLSAVRDPKSSTTLRAAPTLRLTDAIDCLRFFRSVVRLTADAAAVHVGQGPPAWGTEPALALGVHVSQL